MRVAVVGGGISGLTAAYRLRTLLGAGAEITVFESTEQVGGKLRTIDLGGSSVDIGAEAFLVRRPEALALVEELGLGERLVHPRAVRATVRAGGRIVRLPARTLMGIPADPAEVAGVLSAGGAAEVAAERELPAVKLPPEDVWLGALLRERFGDELVDRLVNPLLTGVYGGGADGLGLRAVLPALADVLDTNPGSLTDAVASLLPAASDAPVFGTLRGGFSVLLDRLVEAARAEVVTKTTVRALHRSHTGWQLEADRTHEADAVALAVPAPAARRLLADVAPDASRALGEVALASMAVVALELPGTAELPEASGVLIGAGERHADGTPFTAKAFTYSSRKWQHHAEAGVHVRGSVGRFGDVEALRATDAQLIEQVRTDLAELTGLAVEPVAAAVRRWGGGLPQYDVGHVERVARIERAVGELPGLAIAGATLHGVGIPACMATADAAAREVASVSAVRD